MDSFSEGMLTHRGERAKGGGRQDEMAIDPGPDRRSHRPDPIPYNCRFRLQVGKTSPETRAQNRAGGPREARRAIIAGRGDRRARGAYFAALNRLVVGQPGANEPRLNMPQHHPSPVSLTSNCTPSCVNERSECRGK